MRDAGGELVVHVLEVDERGFETLGSPRRRKRFDSRQEGGGPDGEPGRRGDPVAPVRGTVALDPVGPLDPSRPHEEEVLGSHPGQGELHAAGAVLDHSAEDARRLGPADVEPEDPGRVER